MFKRQINRDLVEAGYALAVTFAIGKWAIYYAYLERGYEAIGGEWLLILVAYLVAYMAIHYLFDVLEELGYERQRKKRRSRGAVGIQDYSRAIR